ncbi:hypothetical protein EB796_018351 [Bugula neritina]|uniref:Uncharacterized protein n=1 Tax=Bugula neritina TaxID=10212 RepID=A0A7J7JD88_BUGNE|nr:hypothetical protein EB796_018351 [Bugula neritina]
MLYFIVDSLYLSSLSVLNIKCITLLRNIYPNIYSVPQANILLKKQKETTFDSELETVENYANRKQKNNKN